MSTPEIERLATNRVETRFTGTSPLHTLPEGMSELVYPDQLVSSIYFGTDNAGQRVPPGAGIRFRYRAAEEPMPDHKVSIIDSSQTGTLELKLQQDALGQTTERTSKYYAPDMEFGDVAAMLANPSQKRNSAGREHAELFDTIADIFAGQPARPLVLFQAMRRHFLLEQVPLRLTFDTHNSLWMIGNKQLPGFDWFAARAKNLAHNILEIKSPADLAVYNIDPNDLAHSIFGRHSDYAQQDESKRTMTEAVIEKLGFPIFSNPELVKSATRAHIRSFYERELKLDTTTDPREALRALPKKTTGMYLENEQRSDIRFRNHKLGDLTIVEKAKDDDFTISGFQHKTPVEADQPDQLTRIELTDTSLETLLVRLGRADLLDTLAETGLSTDQVFGTRYRIARRIVSALTGNLFVLLADHCEASDGRPPLDQLEIEYLGKIAFAGDEQPDPTAINNDFARLKGLLRTAMNTKLSLKESQRTKQDWLS